MEVPFDDKVNNLTEIQKFLSKTYFADFDGL